MNSDNDSINNFNNIENSIRAFCVHNGKFPEINNNEKNKLIIIDTLQNNGNDMITQQTNVNVMIEIPKMKVIVNKPYLLIPNKFENFAQILLFLNTNKFKMVNRNYRKQYTAIEKQRIYRIKKVIKAFHQ